MVEDQGISIVGVVGSGVMGSGIAQVCIQSGYKVLIYDSDQTALDKSYRKIERALYKWCEKNGNLNHYDQYLNMLNTAERLDKMASADLIVEAVVEQLDIKQHLFAQLDSIVKPSTILASNTSGIRISDIAAKSKNRSRMVGMHFFNPATRMQVVEVVRGEETSVETLEKTIAFVKSIDKVPIVAKDVPGFVVNRIVTPMINQAIKSLEQGIASARDIDTGIKLAMRYPMGPLELADFIGLDLILNYLDTMYSQGEEAFKPTQLHRKLVSEGHLGIKTGKGFYEYNDSK